MTITLASLVAALGLLGASLAMLLGRYRRLAARAARLAGADRPEQLTQLREKNHALEQRHGQLLARLSMCQQLVAQRPTLERRVYNVVTLGVTACGKTALTFKWAQPTFRLQDLVATIYQQYERTVSRQWIARANTLRDHVFEVLDWGGEFMTDVQSALLTVERINALIIVVDLGVYDPARGQQVFSRERVRQQIELFNAHVLQLFFSEHVLEHCRTFVLFINKADLLSGTWTQAEREACDLYRRLIDTLRRYDGYKGIEVRVIVGSAQAGHYTHELFGYLIERILPRDAFDDQLNARLGPAPGAGTHAGPPPEERPTLLVAPPRRQEEGSCR